MIFFPLSLVRRLLIVLKILPFQFCDCFIFHHLIVPFTGVSLSLWQMCFPHFLASTFACRLLGRLVYKHWCLWEVFFFFELTVRESNAFFIQYYLKSIRRKARALPHMSCPSMFILLNCFACVIRANTDAFMIEDAFFIMTLIYQE